MHRCRNNCCRSEIVVWVRNRLFRTEKSKINNKFTIIHTSLPVMHFSTVLEITSSQIFSSNVLDFVLWNLIPAEVITVNYINYDSIAQGVLKSLFLLWFPNQYQVFLIKVHKQSPEDVLYKRFSYKFRKEMQIKDSFIWTLLECVFFFFPNNEMLCNWFLRMNFRCTWDIHSSEWGL